MWYLRCRVSYDVSAASGRRGKCHCLSTTARASCLCGSAPLQPAAVDKPGTKRRRWPRPTGVLPAVHRHTIFIAKRPPTRGFDRHRPSATIFLTWTDTHRPADQPIELATRDNYTRTELRAVRGMHCQIIINNCGTVINGYAVIDSWNSLLSDS